MRIFPGHIIFALPLLWAAFLTTSCQKDDITSSDDDQIVSIDTAVQAQKSDYINDILGPFLSGLDGLEEARDTIASFILDNSYMINEEGLKMTPMESADAFYNVGDYSTANIQYMSVDGNGNPIVLSARLAWRSKKKNAVKGIVVYLHETITDNASAPSVIKSNAIERLAINNNLIVMPDYIGFGNTSSMTQTYLSHELIARNCLDAVIAAINACKDETKYPDLPHEFNSDAGTYITGYSQGGANALALHKYIETKATQEERELVNLKHSFIGSGPYNPTETFNYWLSEGKMSFPILLPLVLDGMKAGGNSNLNGFDVSSCFTQTFNDCDFLGDLRGKQKSLLDVYQKIITNLRPYSSRGEGDVLPYFQLDSIMNPDIRNVNSSNRIKIDKALADQNLLSDDWVPSNPITFFYTSYDDVVPPVNTTLAYEKWKDSGKVKIIDCKIKNHLVAEIVYEIYAIRFDLYKNYKDIQKNAELRLLVNEMTEVLTDALFLLY